MWSQTWSGLLSQGYQYQKKYSVRCYSNSRQHIIFCAVGVLDTKQPHAKHHHPSDRADCCGTGWRVQALPSSAHPTHVARLHARQQHRAQCYHQGEWKSVQFRWQKHQTWYEIVDLYQTEVFFLLFSINFKEQSVMKVYKPPWFKTLSAEAFYTNTIPDTEPQANKQMSLAWKQVDAAMNAYPAVVCTP